MDAKALRSEYVTGNYFSTLGDGVFGGRLLTADDDHSVPRPRWLGDQSSGLGGKLWRRSIRA